MLSLALFFAAAFTFASSQNAQSAPLTTVSYVDLNRYMGTWYEIAAIPQSFQRQCVSDTTAEYDIVEDNLVRVINSCEKADHSRSVSEGRAKVVDRQTNAKLKVTFVNVGDKYFFAFGGKYWITYLDENYRFAIVGHPNRNYGWILARDPAIQPNELQALAIELKMREYNVCEFLVTPQKNGQQMKSRLCDVVNVNSIDQAPL